MRSLSEMPEDWYVFTEDFGAPEPYCLAFPPDEYLSENGEKFAIPKPLAYFLITHWPGPPQLRENHRREMANDIKRILQIK